MEKDSWVEFTNSGMLWWINRILHTFGWAIVVVFDNDEFVYAYPTKVNYRGFSRETEEKGFMSITNYLYDNIEKIRNDVL